MSNHPLLQLRNIQLNIENFALCDIQLEIYPGEIHAIMGENGSGKSLLMEIISGEMMADTGAIYYDGHLYNPTTYIDVAKQDCLYIRQDAQLLENLTIAENLFFSNMPAKGHLFKRIDYDLLNHMYKELIDQLELPLTDNDTVSSIGYAQKQIIEFCKAYISDAPVIILDEPSASLTLHETQLLYNIVDSIRAKGAAIFYISHNIDEVMTIADRISVLRKGAVIGTVNTSETTEQEIIRLLSIDHLSDRYPKIHTKIGRPIMTVNDLSYEDKLRDINFTLHEGEILGITGLAGSGRSLLASCLFGDATYDGTILIDGKPLKINSPRAAIKNGIALMPEDRMTDSVISYMNTDENVALPSLKRFSNRNIIDSNYLKQSTTEYIKRINIPGGQTRDITTYSGSSLQKAIFAKWIMSRAKIFVLDEPNKGVDIPSKIDTYNFINDLVSKKAGVLFISSDIEEIFGICDRVAVLSDNTFTYIGSVKNTSVEDIVRYATSDPKIS